MADILAELMARRGYGRTQTNQSLAAAWQEAVQESFPNQPPLRCHVANLRGGTLEIVLENSIVMQELQFQKHQLVAALRARLPDTRLRDIRFRVGAVAPEPPSNSSTPPNT